MHMLSVYVHIQYIQSTEILLQFLHVWHCLIIWNTHLVDAFIPNLNSTIQTVKHDSFLTTSDRYYNSKYLNL